MEAERWDLVIVGAGTGGLVLALESARRGLRVAVLDRQPSSVSLPRGEILQPNGLKILDRLGLLPGLLKCDLYRNRRVDFYQMAGPLLCSIDYQRLPPPYDYSLILLPEVIQQLLLKEVAAVSNIQIFWGTAFRSVLWKGDRVVGVEADHGGSRHPFLAPIVVGADGPRSAVRARFGIEYDLKYYRDSYLTTVLARPPGFEDAARYYLGRRKIFGVFPISQERLYLFYMIPAGDFEAVRARGLDRLKDELLSLHPDIRALLEIPLTGLSAWEEISYMPCVRVRCRRWVVAGGALLGDAAHAMNPHVAQGRNAAMADGMLLAEVIQSCLQKGDFSKEALSEYEAARRPGVETLQRLGDEMTRFWNSSSPPWVWIRDRVFRSLQRDRSLHDKMLKTVSGLESAPFNLSDRWRALRLGGPLLRAGRGGARG